MTERFLLFDLDLDVDAVGELPLGDAARYLVRAVDFEATGVHRVRPRRELPAASQRPVLRDAQPFGRRRVGALTLRALPFEQPFELGDDVVEHGSVTAFEGEFGYKSHELRGYSLFHTRSGKNASTAHAPRDCHACTHECGGEY